MDRRPEELARRFVETITRVAKAGRGDDEVFALVHPRAELQPIIMTDVLHGREGAASWIQAAREALVWEPTVRRVERVDGTTAVAVIRLRASRPGKGLVDSEIAWVASFDRGLLRQAVSYPSVDDLPERAREALTR